MKTLLVDGDILLYKASCANETKLIWEEDEESSSSLIVDGEKAKEDFKNIISNMLKRTKSDDLLICFSDSINFRYEVYPQYKHNRKELEKPKLFYELKSFAMEKYPFKVKENLEADDVIGILATLYPLKKKECVIASIDKDLKQIPGVHYNWKNDEIYTVDEFEADYWFYFQTLAGDPTDGYPGCPTIGKVKAEKIMAFYFDEFDYAKYRDKNVWKNVIVKEYEKRGLTEQDALVQARVARILRVTDYDFKNKKVKLWEPPKF